MSPMSHEAVVMTYEPQAYISADSTECPRCGSYAYRVWARPGVSLGMAHTVELAWADAVATVLLKRLGVATNGPSPDQG